MAKTYLTNATLTISLQEITEAGSLSRAKLLAFDKLLRELDEFLNENTEAHDMALTVDEVMEYRP